MSANPLRSKLQALGAGTYDPAFANQYKTQLPPANTPPPFVQPPNPAAERSQLLRKKIVLFSDDRDDRTGSTSSDFEITLANSIDQVVKIELRAFICPMGIYNITEANQAFIFTFQWTQANSTLPSAPGNHGPTTGTLYLFPGAYNPRSFAEAVADKINQQINYYIGAVPGASGLEWMEAEVNAQNQIVLSGLDLGLTFSIGAWQTGGIPVGGLTATAPGGQTYYSLTGTLPITLDFHDVIFIQSQALGNKLLSGEGASSGTNAFATIPLADLADPILVRFDNTLDSTYFEPVRNSSNNLRKIDIRITDVRGVILDLRGATTYIEVDVVQKVKADTLGT